MKLWLKRIGTFFLISMLICLTIITFYIHHETKNLPTISKRTLSSDASSNMYSSDGKLIWSSAINKREYVKYNHIPKEYIDLLLSTEDRNFFKDSALSPEGLANAGLSVIKSKLHMGSARGGSTLEQQLIKHCILIIIFSSVTPAHISIYFRY